jgi:hypothetical protein
MDRGLYVGKHDSQIRPGAGIGIRLWVDGRARHNCNTDDMEHPVDELASWTPQVCTLEPSDLISCGTNHQEIGPVQDGERVEIEVERVGRMAVKVHDPQANLAQGDRQVHGGLCTRTSYQSGYSTAEGSGISRMTFTSAGG